VKIAFALLRLEILDFSAKLCRAIRPQKTTFKIVVCLTKLKKIDPLPRLAAAVVKGRAPQK
jgi:hypothetical protein